eukprot:TRINITY_DN11380_c0_g1_i1.p1 TRINITY_DN11380_c0_g1~~TRINITY_DN11380_c0_g1_i1.p1  ORF type:complete len:172 (+),score=17.39 TRINITY_DN11380_c0_g1_i1:56-571(+)
MGGTTSKTDGVVVEEFPDLDRVLLAKWQGRAEGTLEHLYERCKKEPLLPQTLSVMEELRDGERRYAEGLVSEMVRIVEQRDEEATESTLRYQEKLEIGKSTMFQNVFVMPFTCLHPVAQASAQPGSIDFLVLRTKHLFYRSADAAGGRGSYGLPFTTAVTSNFTIRPDEVD